ncbi:RNA polymerase sigma-70 factor [Carboxylicivirga marina]|uniref:RNA polymerase sigma-70 factor n=1 Tax=Carboxylicivirga marina TaxID=2800988 RepID=A0ABS1HH91_9BACT|nr:RNA polymerase sigma-70 factor [Carboxylicivirga marina]MBK3516986.1 RNA polymerase sigma-70 factor [Carboxylicivirga marina]
MDIIEIIILRRVNNIEIIASQFLKNKDLKSFKLLYDSSFRRLCFFAESLLADKQDVEDVVQDALVLIWERRHKIDDSINILGYMYMVVKNKCLNTNRSIRQAINYKNHHNHLIEFDDTESLRIIKSEVYNEILESLEKLPERARMVFRLSYLTQMTESDIADRLNISVNSVKTHKKRAKEILKKDLQHLFSLILLFKFLS